MSTITRTATKSWTGAQSASTVLISVPKTLWTGRASLVALRGSGWARVLDGRSAAFWNGPATFADHPTMRAFTDTLVVQFMSEDDSLGSATGIFESHSGYLGAPLPILRVAAETAWVGGRDNEVAAVHRHVVMEGAAPLADDERERFLDHITGGSGGIEQIPLDPEQMLAARLARPSGR